MDQKKNDFATAPVPASERKGFWDTAAVWVGWCISLSAFLTGGTIAAGCTLWEGIIAVLAGNLLLVFIACLHGIIGYRTGLTTYTAYRMIFGKKGNVIVSFVNAISLMAFIGVLMDSFSNTLHGLIPWFPIPLASTLFALCILSSAINGFKGLAFISKIAAPALWILLAVCFVLTLTKPGASEALMTWAPETSIPFITAMGAAVSTWIGGATKVADLTRYSKSIPHVVGGAFVGYIGGAAVFESVAVVCAIGAGNANIVVVMASLGLLIPAVIVLGLALWTTTDNNIYSAVLAFIDMGEILHINIPKKIWTVVCVGIALGVSLLGMSNDFKLWLNIIGTLAGPLAGIMISHFFIIHKWNTKEYFVPENFGIPAFITWVASFIIAQNTPSAIPAVAAIIISFVLYTILALIEKAMKIKQAGSTFTIQDMDAPAEEKAE